MSIFSPANDWCKPPEGAERTWVIIALVWCMIMFLMMPYWHFKGKQNSTGESYRVKEEDFMNRVNKFVETNTVGNESGIPIVEVEPGGDGYMLGQMWRWYPILKLKKGQEYRIHLSSVDLNHGFGVLPLNMNFHVLPGYDHVLTLTPTRAGDYQIICNEFCGIGHHLMTGKIIVE
ncbi:cytochrome C oxidase subunit II [bacterium]|jgi:cytochrome c oxidase subunit II|nr:cytochrome C oxidase subunit II [bacterium]